MADKAAERVPARSSKPRLRTQEGPGEAVEGRAAEQAELLAGAGTGAVAGGLLTGALGGTRREALAGAVVGGLAGAGIAYVAQVRRKYGVTRGKFARLSNVSERTLMEWEKADPPDETKLRTIRELDRLHEALAHVIDPEAIAPWLERPNDAFGGSTPLQVIERGESDRLWRMVFFLETGATF